MRNRVLVALLAFLAPAVLADDVKIEVDTSRPYKPGDRVAVKVTPAPGVSIQALRFWIGGKLESDLLNFPTPVPGKPMTGYFVVPQWVTSKKVDLIVNPECQGGQSPMVAVPQIKFQNVRQDSTPPVISNLKITEDKSNSKVLRFDFDVAEHESGLSSFFVYYFEGEFGGEVAKVNCTPTQCSGTMDRFKAGLSAHPTIHFKFSDKAGNDSAEQKMKLTLTDLSSSPAPKFSDFKATSCESALTFTFQQWGSRNGLIHLHPHLDGGGSGDGAARVDYIAESAEIRCSGSSCKGVWRLPALLPKKIGRLDFELSGANGTATGVDLLKDLKVGPILQSCLNQIPVRSGSSIRRIDVRHADQVIRGGGGGSNQVGRPPR